MSDWEQASQLDADLLFIGEMPEGIKRRPDANLLLQDTQATLNQPRMIAHGEKPKNNDLSREGNTEQAAQSVVSVRSLAPLAAIVGLQSEHHPQRSVVGLLATTDEDYDLLRDAFGSTGKREAMEGSVVLIRKSGVDSNTVGPKYHVGELSWWKVLWYNLSERPILLGAAAFLLVLLLALLARNLLRQVARKRLERDA